MTASSVVWPLDKFSVDFDAWKSARCEAMSREIRPLDEVLVGTSTSRRETSKKLIESDANGRSTIEALLANEREQISKSKASERLLARERDVIESIDVTRAEIEEMRVEEREEKAKQRELEKRIGEIEKNEKQKTFHFYGANLVKNVIGIKWDDDEESADKIKGIVALNGGVKQFEFNSKKTSFVTDCLWDMIASVGKE